MRLIVVFVFLFMTISGLQAQQKGVSLGDTVWFGACTGKAAYRFVDVYTHTRVTDTTATYDATTGEGFFNYFFKNGDLDGGRMLCNGHPLYAIIISVEELPDKETATMKQVMLAWIDRKAKKLAWIEVNAALESGEAVLK